MVMPQDSPPTMRSPEGNNEENLKFRFKTNFKPKKILKHYPYFGDPLLMPRVRQYLEDNKDKIYIDINDMVDDLRKKYRDYSLKKRMPFKKSVEKAFTVILQNHGLLNPSSDSSEDSEEDLEEVVPEQQERNVLNERLTGMYKQKQSNSKDSGGRSKNQSEKSPESDQELIDICSEEEVEVKEADGEVAEPPKSKKESKISKEGEAGDNKEGTAKVSRQSKKRKASSDLGNPKRKKEVPFRFPTETFADVGGNEKCLEQVCRLLMHVRHPEIYRQLGVSPPRGVLLHGPPGCGKTLLAHAIAGELQVPLLKVAGPELVAGISGESEERIRDLFDQACASAPCILFLDEVDAITPNRQTAQREMERRIVAQLLSCLDELSKQQGGDHVLVIGATNRPDSLEPALRRAGRFDHEVCLGIPDVKARAKILEVLCRNLKLSEDIDFQFLASHSPGYVGADLMSLTREAALSAVNRVFGDLKYHKEQKEAPKSSDTNREIEICSVENGEVRSPDLEICENQDTEKMECDVVGEKNAGQSENKVPNGVIAEGSEEKIVQKDTDTSKSANSLSVKDLILWLREQAPLSREQLEGLSVNMDDFRAALKNVQPSAKREGFATVPDVTWDDIGALTSVREELKLAVLAPVRYADQFEMLGLTTPTGVLLCGPPGCGKTLLAKAVANEAAINFISVKGPELMNMYVGESERAVRQCFQRARNSAPCVIFFDELDALCPKRSEVSEGNATMRVVNQMLTEMDGIEGRKGVYLMAATNRPDIVDPAVMRPGRFDKILYVGLPTPEDRVDILRALTKGGTRPLLDEDVDLEEVAKDTKCDAYTGADLAALVREAGILALKEHMMQSTEKSPIMVSGRHFKKALCNIRPSVTKKDQKHYEKLQELYGIPSSASD